MWYRVTFTSGALLVTRQDSEQDARDRAARTSPKSVIKSVEGFTTKDEASK